LIAEQELDDAQSKDMASESRVDAAKSALAAAKQQSEGAKADNERVGALADYSKVTAPLDGVIVWRYADTGALIQAGTSSDTQSLPVVKLSQSSLLRLRLPVPEDAVEFVHEGATVTVNVDAVHRAFEGKVVRFTRNLNPATRTMETEIDVPNKDLSLTPGMYANTKIELERHDRVLTIPVEAVLRNGNQTSVLVVDANHHVVPRTIVMGLQGTNLVEVKSGLAEGDEVITGGQANYEAGETVIPNVRPTSESDVSEEQSGGTK
jgi:RND family efflux transporter MFP subunit